MFDEDCLFVNVFKPTNATAAAKLPVWLFIQGGGYARNDNGNFNGSEVVQKSGGNVVFVNFNYRVGVLGFLAGGKVRQDGALNAGLLDQRQLLQWVQKYISQVCWFVSWSQRHGRVQVQVLMLLRRSLGATLSMS